MFAAKNELFTRPSGGYQISRSLRFNSADSAYLSRTPASATNRRTWTWSGWVKRSALGSLNDIFGVRVDSNNGLRFYFDSSDKIACYNETSATVNANLVTTQVFRDVSAWYHIVLAIDTTNATAGDRMRLYINGSEVTAFNTDTQPTQNLDTQINTTNPHYLGYFSAATGNQYMTEINFVDGTQLTPSSFGETNAQTGVWQPKAYSGSYGTNGFYLNFSDNSNTTAATLGKDYSGNGNNFTPNNFSVTAGAGNDSLVDVPTPYGIDTGAGGTVRGNYCTMNPIANPSTPTYSITNGNLDYAATGGVGAASKQAAIATIGVTTGKWYYEGTVTSNNPGLGFSSELFFNSQRGTIRITYFTGSLENSAGITATGTPATFTNGDVIAVAYDADAGTATVYKNNVSQGTFSGIAIGTALFPYVEPNTAAAASGVSFNFGQRPFAYTAPSGFKALCTQNLPTPTIGATTATQAGKFFNPVLWTGDSTNPRTITGVGFQPDWVWVKRRDAGSNHFLQDAVRGVTSTNSRSLSSNNTDAETNYYTLNGGVTAFTSDGFTTSGGATNLNINSSGSTFVAWNWRASNATAVSNTAGTITSQVSASTTSGFSVITYSGTAVAATIGHGLGVAPSMIISKRTGGGNWAVYHKTLGINQYVFLNSTAAANTVNDYWGTTSPTSTVFGVIGGGYDNNSGPAVAYCFAPIAGYSAFGSYTGNGSTDGPFVFTGFRPAFVMVKNASNPYTNWYIIDSARNTYNATGLVLRPDTTDAEQNYTPVLDFLSNGFKIRDTGSPWNGSSELILYACFASNPFKYSLAR